MYTVHIFSIASPAQTSLKDFHASPQDQQWPITASPGQPAPTTIRVSPQIRGWVEPCHGQVQILPGPARRVVHSCHLIHQRPALRVVVAPGPPDLPVGRLGDRGGVEETACRQIGELSESESSTARAPSPSPSPTRFTGLPSNRRTPTRSENPEAMREPGQSAPAAAAARGCSRSGDGGAAQRSPSASRPAKRGLISGGGGPPGGLSESSLGPQAVAAAAPRFPWRSGRGGSPSGRGRACGRPP
jgi:hypothetical protein